MNPNLQSMYNSIDIDSVESSKHLKGRLGPRVSDAFWIKGGQLGSHVSDAFWIKGGRLGSHVSDAFWVKGGQLGSRLVFHGSRLVFLYVYCILARRSSLGLAGRRPALA